jgi:hypothetical protein
MKKYVFLLVFFAFAVSCAYAQDVLYTLVYSQNKCHYQHMDELVQTIKEEAGPVLIDLVKKKC